MQGTWYGDRIDRMKWGALVHLASRFRLASILQIAYLRDNPEGRLTTDEGERPIADEVWKHFDDLTAIEGLSRALGLEICVYAERFNPRKRDEYLAGALRAAKQRPRPRLLLLDPDTGIVRSALTAKHASRNEIAGLWKALDTGEVLAVYQHGPRVPRDAAWFKRSAQSMATACEGAQVRAIQGTVAGQVAKGVVLWAQKDTV